VKKFFAFVMIVVLVIAMAVPACAVTPAMKAPNLPKIPEIQTNVRVKVTGSFWNRWFASNPVPIMK
jgi:heme/copper-type cytochrome/quinol oxidase subunit 2